MAGKPSITEQLKKLHELHQKGLLSDEDFSSMKKKLIDQMRSEENTGTETVQKSRIVSEKPSSQPLSKKKKQKTTGIIIATVILAGILFVWLVLPLIQGTGNKDDIRKMASLECSYLEAQVNAYNNGIDPNTDAICQKALEEFTAFSKQLEEKYKYQKNDQAVMERKRIIYTEALSLCSIKQEDLHAALQKYRGQREITIRGDEPTKGFGNMQTGKYYGKINSYPFTLAIESVNGNYISGYTKAGKNIASYSGTYEKKSVDSYLLILRESDEDQRDNGIFRLTVDARNGLITNGSGYWKSYDNSKNYPVSIGDNSTGKIEENPTVKKRYTISGNIGTRAAIIVLEDKGENNCGAGSRNVSGNYYYLSDKDQSMKVSGKICGNKIYLTEYDSLGNKNTSFEGIIKKNEIKGVWKYTNGQTQNCLLYVQ